MFFETRAINKHFYVHKLFSLNFMTKKKDYMQVMHSETAEIMRLCSYHFSLFRVMTDMIEWQTFAVYLKIEKYLNLLP